MSISPNEANPPLIVDADRMLPAPILRQCLKPIAGRHPEIIECPGIVDETQLSQRDGLDIRR
jgi:hypothetical protein